MEDRACDGAISLSRHRLASADELLEGVVGELGDTDVPRCHIDRVADSAGNASLESFEGRYDFPVSVVYSLCRSWFTG